MTPESGGRRWTRRLLRTCTMRRRSARTRGRSGGRSISTACRLAAAQECVPRPLHQLGHLRGRRRHRQRARVDAAGIEQVADQVLGVIRLLVDDAEELVHLGRVQGRRRAEPGAPPTPGWRPAACAQFVAHHVQELRLQPPQFLQRRKILQGHHHRLDHAVPGTDRRGVDQRPDAAAVGSGQHDLLGEQGLGVAQLLGQRELVERVLAAIREPAPQHVHHVLQGALRQAHALGDPARLAVEIHRVTGPGIEHHDAHRAGVPPGLRGRRAPAARCGACARWRRPWPPAKRTAPAPSVRPWQVPARRPCRRGGCRRRAGPDDAWAFRGRHSVPSGPPNRRVSAGRAVAAALPP